MILSDNLENLMSQEVQWITSDDSYILRREHRKIAASWLLDVANEFSMHTRTFLIALHIFDRCISSKTFDNEINAITLERLAIASLWIASKYEEVPVYTCSDMYELVHLKHHTLRDLNDMEVRVLKIIDFRLSHPLPTDFIEAMCLKEEKCLIEIVIKYMIEYIPMHRPSDIAGAALEAMGIVGKNEVTNPNLLRDMKSICVCLGL